MNLISSKIDGTLHFSPRRRNCCLHCVEVVNESSCCLIEGSERAQAEVARTTVKDLHLKLVPPKNVSPSQFFYHHANYAHISPHGARTRRAGKESKQTSMITALRTNGIPISAGSR